VPLIGIGPEPMQRRVERAKRCGAEIDFGHDQRSQK
jgi:hypothetical protein